MTDEYRLIDVSATPNGMVACLKEEYLSTGVVAEMLWTELQQVLQNGRPRILVLDLSQVRMISSSTIGVFLRLRNQMQQAGGQLRLANVAIPIVEVYRTLNLTEKQLPVYDSVPQALAIPWFDSEEDREVMED